jgi:hypothetical protein
MLEDSGFTDISVGDAVDTFGGAAGEGNARGFEVFGYTFRARRPAHRITRTALPETGMV